MYYTLYGKCICYLSFTLHFIKSMLKLKTKKYTAETNNYTLLSEESKKTTVVNMLSDARRKKDERSEEICSSCT